VFLFDPTTIGMEKPSLIHFIFVWWPEDDTSIFKLNIFIEVARVQILWLFYEFQAINFFLPLFISVIYDGA